MEAGPGPRDADCNMSETKPLHLMAEDEADLQLISAAVQDSLLQLGDIGFDAGQRRFVLALNRFRWEAELEGRRRFERARAALAFDDVLSVKVRGLPPRRDNADTIVSLMSAQFEPDAEPPGGKVRLVFAGDGEILLTVECLDATLTDLGPTWTTRRRPDHERKGK